MRDLAMHRRWLAGLVVGVSAMLCAGAAPAPVQVAMVTSAICPHFEITPVAAQGERTVTGPNGKPLRVDKTPLLSMADFTGADVTLTEGQVVLNVSLSHAGGKRVQKFTKNHVGAMIAFVEDGRAIKVVRILDPLTGDGFLIGPLDKTRADALAAKINKYASPCGARG